MTYPGTRSHKQPSHIGPIPRNSHSQDGRAVYKRPEPRDSRVKRAGRHAVALDDSEIGMQRDGRDEDAGGQVPDRHKPALCPAHCSPRFNGVPREPGDIEHEGNGLLDVGEQQVVDQDQELVRRILGQALPERLLWWLPDLLPQRTEGRPRNEEAIAICRGGRCRFW